MTDAGNVSWAFAVTLADTTHDSIISRIPGGPAVAAGVPLGPQRILMTNDRNQTFRSVLDTRSVTFNARWNELDQHWYIDMNVDAVRVLTGRRMVVDANLIATQSELLGQLEVRALGLSDATGPGIGGWDVTHQLVYVEA